MVGGRRLGLRRRLNDGWPGRLSIRVLMADGGAGQVKIPDVLVRTQREEC